MERSCGLRPNSVSSGDATVMGDSKRRKSKFFAEHPRCCFCGGSQRATTEDHQPARSLFDSRCWPEGYVFPACERCNAASRRDEAVLAFVTRLNYTPASTSRGLANAHVMTARTVSAIPTAKYEPSWFRYQLLGTAEGGPACAYRAIRDGWPRGGAPGDPGKSRNFVLNMIRCH